MIGAKGEAGGDTEILEQIAHAETDDGEDGDAASAIVQGPVEEHESELGRQIERDPNEIGVKHARGRDRGEQADQKP
ncbi:MAG: hypothetical protein ACREDO_00725 [Methyloceanibacter sp.]